MSKERSDALAALLAAGFGAYGMTEIVKMLLVGGADNRRLIPTGSFLKIIIAVGFALMIVLLFHRRPLPETPATVLGALGLAMVCHRFSRYVTMVADLHFLEIQERTANVA